MNEDLKKIFQLRNIQHIVYVDDEFSGYNAYKDNCNARCHYLLDIKGELPFDCDSSTIDEEFETWWSKGELLGDFITTQNIQRGTTRIEQNLYELCSDEIDNISLSPEQFVEKRGELISQAEGEKTLFLVDKELTGGISSDYIIELLHDVPNKYVALFSGTFKPEEEISAWLNNDALNNIYPISKTRLENDSFVEGVRNVIWLESISALRDHSIALLRDAFDKVSDSLKAIDPASFDKIVVEVSRKEGCWEFDTLYRIILLMLTQTVQKSITDQSNYAIFQQFTHDVRDVKDVLVNVHSALINDEMVQALQEQELYDDGVYLNSVYAQIGNGDIFTIGDNRKMYMLLCQPCSLAIRDGGKRSYDLDYAFLVPIIDHPKNTYAETLKSVGEEFYVDFSACKRISLDILDLVAYNQEGLAKINLKDEIPQNMSGYIFQENMLYRYQRIREKIAKYYRMYQAVQNSNMKGEEKQICISHFRKPYEMGDPLMVKAPTHVNPNELFFKIQRVKRYKEPYVQDLLQKFMRYLSRPGFAPDLTKNNEQEV